jgi:hypothetical protein
VENSLLETPKKTSEPPTQADPSTHPKSEENKTKLPKGLVVSTALSQEPLTPRVKKPSTKPNKDELYVDFGSQKASGAPEKQQRDEDEKTVDKDAKAPKNQTPGAPGESGKEKSQSEPSALSDWVRQERNGATHYSLGKDHIVETPDLIKGKTGSKQEVAAMFELARSKNWTGIAISGSKDFKKQVMEFALKNKYDVVASGKDLQLLNEVKKSLGIPKASEVQSPGKTAPPQQDSKDKPLSDKAASLSQQSALTQQIKQSKEKHPSKVVGLPELDKPPVQKLVKK